MRTGSMGKDKTRDKEWAATSRKGTGKPEWVFGSIRFRSSHKDTLKNKSSHQALHEPKS